MPLNLIYHGLFYLNYNFIRENHRIEGSFLIPEVGQYLYLFNFDHQAPGKGQCHLSY